MRFEDEIYISLRVLDGGKNATQHLSAEVNEKFSGHRMLNWLDDILPYGKHVTVSLLALCAVTFPSAVKES